MVTKEVADRCMEVGLSCVRVYCSNFSGFLLEDYLLAVIAVSGYF